MMRSSSLPASKHKVQGTFKARKDSSKCGEHVSRLSTRPCTLWPSPCGERTPLSCNFSSPCTAHPCQTQPLPRHPACPHAHHAQKHVPPLTVCAPQTGRDPSAGRGGEANTGRRGREGGQTRSREVTAVRQSAAHLSSPAATSTTSTCPQRTPVSHCQPQQRAERASETLLLCSPPQPLSIHDRPSHPTTHAHTPLMIRAYDTCTLEPTSTQLGEQGSAPRRLTLLGLKVIWASKSALSSISTCFHLKFSKVATA